MAVAWGLVWWLFDRAQTRGWRDLAAGERPRQAILKARLRLAWRGVPLGIALMLVSLNPNVPRYFIEAMLGLGALGLFAAMAHFIVAGRMLVGAVCQAASPRLADLYAAGELAAFRALLARLLAASLLVGLAGPVIALAFGRELLALIYGPPFAEGAGVFVWIMVVGAVALVQTPLGYGLTVMQQFGVQPVIFGVAAAINIVCCLLLVPDFGLLGATFGWLGAVLCQLILSLAVHWRCLRPRGGSAATSLSGPG